jgi:hypothetical protein
VARSRASHAWRSGASDCIRAGSAETSVPPLDAVRVSIAASEAMSEVAAVSSGAACVDDVDGVVVGGSAGGDFGRSGIIAAAQQAHKHPNRNGFP